MEDSSSEITMFYYRLKEGDVKEPVNKFSLIPKKWYIIGRSEKNADIVLDEKLLSRKHAELAYYNKSEIYIRDLESRNGTYINKNRIEPNKDVLFTKYDVLSFGDLTNEIVFYDSNEDKKTENIIYKEKIIQQNDNKEDNDNYLNKNENRHYSKLTETEEKKINIKNDYKSYSKSKSNPKSKSRKERSRSRENKKNNSNKYTGLENLIRDLNQKNNNLDIYKEFSFRNNIRNNNPNSDENYRNKNIYDKEKNSINRNINYYSYGNEYNTRNSYYQYRNRNDKRRYYTNKYDNDRNDSGYIKCFVSGYMMLNIRK